MPPKLSNQTKIDRLLNKLADAIKGEKDAHDKSAALSRVDNQDDGLAASAEIAQARSGKDRRKIEAELAKLDYAVSGYSDPDIERSGVEDWEDE